MRKSFGAVAGIFGVVALGYAGVLFSTRSAEPPIELGVHDGKLAPCPDKPNCVSSQATDSEHAVSAIRYNGNTAAAKMHLLNVLHDQPRMSLLQVTDNYMHAVFRSATFGFPDDVEFYFDEPAKVIHVRSASRMGYGDMGVNRARVAQLSIALAPLVQ